MTNPLDYSTWGRDNVVFPVPAPGQHSALQDVDPALFYALDFLSAQIQTHLGPRILSAAQEAGAQAITSAVAQRYPWAPEPEQLQAQLKFPLLAIWRTKTRHEQLTSGWYLDHGEISLMYAFPPVTAGMLEQLGPLLYAVGTVVTHQTVQSFDPSYTPPGGNLGDSPWGAKYAGVEEIGWTRSVFGKLPGGGNMVFPALLMEGFIRSRDVYVSQGNKFTGADITGNLQSADGTVISPMVQVSTQPAPTVTGVAPSTGPVAGGTSLTVTGTGFVAGAAVFVGGVRVPPSSVTVSSSTSLSFNSPAAQNPGAQPITVWNRDGQSGSLTNAFTYF